MRFIPRYFPQFDFGLVERQQYVTLAENHIFSPALLNSFHFSYSRSHVVDSTPSSSNPDEIDWAQLFVRHGACRCAA